MDGAGVLIADEQDLLVYAAASDGPGRLRVAFSSAVDLDSMEVSGDVVITRAADGLVSGYMQGRGGGNIESIITHDDLGLRYDSQTLTDATADFAPRVGFGWHPNGDPRLSIRGGYGMYYTQVRTNSVAGYIMNGLDGFTTYTTPNRTSQSKNRSTSPVPGQVTQRST